MTTTVRDQQNELVLAQMRELPYVTWWAAEPLASACRVALGFERSGSGQDAARSVIDRALRRLRRRGLVESSGGGLWRAVKA